MARQNCDTSSTFALSTDVTFLRRLPGQLKGDAGNAHNLVARITHGVPCSVRFAIPRPRLAKVEAAQQFAHKEDVCAGGHLRTKRRVGSECWKGKSGPQIGKTAQRLAKLQQAGFGPAIRGKGIEFVPSHCAEENCVAVERCVEGLLRERSAFRTNGLAADECFGELEIVAPTSATLTSERSPLRV